MRIAGEWGHNPLPWPRDDERPGTGASAVGSDASRRSSPGPGLERDHRASPASSATARDIVASPTAATPACEATLARYEERLARALAHVINILDPDVIVLGGGLSNIDRAVRARAAQLWGAWVFSDRVDTQLVRHVHGDASGVRGAAWLWPVEGAG